MPMNEPNYIYKSALAVIRDRKLLLVRSYYNETAFYTLGGTIEDGESEIECLKREVKEEIATDLNENSLSFLEEFSGPAHGKENTIVNIKLYEGELMGNPTPSSEIAEIRYFDSTIEEKHITDLTRQIIGWLNHKNYID